MATVWLMEVVRGLPHLGRGRGGHGVLFGLRALHHPTLTLLVLVIAVLVVVVVQRRR